KTYEERVKVFEEEYPKQNKLSPKFLELAEKYPKDPVAFDALIWIVTNNVRSPAHDPARAKAMAILIRDHAQSEKLGPVCQTLAQVLKRRLEMTPGGETTAPQVLKECEKLLRRAADEFGDVKLASGGTVGDKAQVELDDILHLAVGKVAPDIEGEDQDGKKFKLSDYRGKVVLLDFWHQ